MTHNKLINGILRFLGYAFVAALFVAVPVYAERTTSPGDALPSQTGNSGKYLTTNGSVASWNTVSGTGDVVGPSSSTDNAIARFDSTTGKLLQNSATTVGDNGDITITVPSGVQETKGGINLVHTNGTGTSQYRISQDEGDYLTIKRMTGDTTGDGLVYSIINLISPNSGAVSGDNESTFSLTSKAGFGASSNISRTLDLYNDEYSRDNGMGFRQLYKNTTPNPIRFEFHDKTTNNGAWNITGCTFTSGSPTVTCSGVSGVTPSADDWIWDNAGTYVADDTKLISVVGSTYTMNRNATASGSGIAARGKNIKEVMRLTPDKQLLVRKFIPASSTSVAEFGGEIFVDGTVNTGALVKINATSGNPEFDLVEASTVRSKVYFDITNDRMTFQNNQNNAADALYFVDPITTTGNVTLGGTLIMGTNSMTLTGSIGATGARSTKGWFTDIESTNMPTVGGVAILTSLTAPQFTTIELGHATQNTLSASSGVLSVEGVVVPTISSTNTLTNKRITSRVTTTASAATVTPNADTDDIVTITAQAAGLTIANPTGTPTEGQRLLIRLKDNGTARAVGFGANYRASADMPLPTTTILSKTMYMGFIYNSTDTKWDFVSYIDNI